MSKRLGGIIGYKYKTSSWHLVSHFQRMYSSHEPIERSPYPAICTEYTTECMRNAGWGLVCRKIAEEHLLKLRRKQIQADIVRVENDRAGAGRDGQTCFRKTKFLAANGGGTGIQHS